MVPYPKETMAPGGYIPGEAQPPEILLYYSAQLYLRKLLNDIQKELYQESKSTRFQLFFFPSNGHELTTSLEDPTFKRATRSTSLRNAFNDMISAWRARLPERLQWEENEAVANNINDARLRGKYYGAQYIIHRPFLHAALDYDFDTPQMQSPPNNAGSAVPTLPAPGPEMGPPRANSDTESRRAETIQLAAICIHAAMRSTVAFDGVLDHRRLVVTNIMGTAHA